MSDKRGNPGFDPEEVLRGLKDFQRLTVDYVYHRLYEAEDRVNRFLIADEVGLGKTLVARGVIARAIQKLWDEVRRIDIIYICSNADIARQNISRLEIPGIGTHTLSTRITLLPVKLGDLEQRKVNLVAFTPGTSFNTGQQSGIAKERAMIYHMLRDEWGFADLTGPMNLFQCNMSKSNWRQLLGRYDTSKIDSALKQGFLEELRKHKEIKEQFDRLKPSFAHFRKRHNIPLSLREEQLKLIGELRSILARSCLKALEPDLVILDEFQRFRDLLDGEDTGAVLARTLFRYEGVKVLLLSATPYKMYTMNHESEDHYRDFIRTVRFLFDSDEEAAALGEELRRYRQELLRLDSGETPGLESLRDSVKRRLHRVMVRTERLAVSEDRDGMLETKAGLAEMAPADLLSFRTVDRLARVLEVPDTVEYWKSAPYLLNLMDRRGYKIKEKLLQRIDSQQYGRAIFDILAEGASGLLTSEEIAAYKKIDPGNARLRAFLSSTVEQGSWKLLWVPPALPYYRPEGSFLGGGRGTDFTKALVFSSWKVVPKVIAMLCSYEAERRMTTLLDKEADYFEERRKRRPLLRFSLAGDRLTGMPNLNLLYPCWTLATLLDPLQAALQRGSGVLPSLKQVQELYAKLIEERLQPLIDRHSVKDRPNDEQWYWAALALLDREYSSEVADKWLNSIDDGIAWRKMADGRSEREDEDSKFAEHVDQFYSCFCKGWELGKPPGDLYDVLAKTALASPAVAALRSLMRLYPREIHEALGACLMAAAARIAMGFRTMFNLAESITLIRGEKDHEGTRYWESVLNYCCEGNLQAVMDEYVHLLRDNLGNSNLQDIAGEIQKAVSIRTVSLDFDEFKVTETGNIAPDRHSLRCRYALRFGQERDVGQDEQYWEARPEQVRRAFNSPFRPFVLATTSIGQEGLDFHCYCHDLYHWNLPANPVDLEQREGRVHRFKGHAIRRNIAVKYGLPALAGNIGPFEDPWELLFQKAAQERGIGKNDLVPFWIYEGPYKIRRNVPSLPLSRDEQLLDCLRSDLVYYRLVFGQPRQEDLLDCIRRHSQEKLDLEKLAKYRIDLSPPGGGEVKFPPTPGQAPLTKVTLSQKLSSRH